MDDTQGLVEQLRRLAVESTLDGLKERRRLAILLHDKLQQLIVGASVQVTIMRRDPSGPLAAESIESLTQTLREAVEASRELSGELFPPPLQRQKDSLTSALSWLAGRMQERHDLFVHLRIDPSVNSLAEPLILILLHSVQTILQALATNSSVRDSRLTMTLEPHGVTVILDSLEEGKEIPTDFIPGQTLLALQQQLAYFGGSLEIAPAVGQGTRLTASIPFGKDATEKSDAAEATASAAGDVAKKKHRKNGIQILLVDDHDVYRQGLKGLLQFEPDMEIVGEAADAPQALEMAGLLQPDVILLDVSLPGMSGIDLARQLVRRVPRTRIIGLSMHDDPRIQRELQSAGAEVCLCKDCEAADLLGAVRDSKRHATL